MKYSVGFAYLPVLLLIFAVPMSSLTCCKIVSAHPAELGDIVEIGQFGRNISAESFVGVQWNNPRDVYEVHMIDVDARFATSLRVEWWGSVWPANGAGGWMRLDDPWNGRWVRIDAAPVPAGAGRYVFKFPPLTKAEWDKALASDQYPDKKIPIFRRTLKVRVITDGRKMPDQARLLVLQNSRWADASLEIQTRHVHDVPVTCRLELANGRLLSIESLPEPRSVKLCGDTWTARRSVGGTSGVRIKVRYVDNEDLSSNDTTRITVRFGEDLRAAGFSFVPQEVLKYEVIELPDFGTLISETSQRATIANCAGPSGSWWPCPVRERLRDRPEMTREAAMAGIPRLSPKRWIPIGVPSARQEFFVGPVGDWMISALSLNTDTGRDAKRWAFKKDFGNERLRDQLFFLLDTRSEPKFDGDDRIDTKRYLQDGCLPLVHTEWQSSSLLYHHQLIATTLLGAYGDDVSRRGDETVVLLSKLQISNPTDKPLMATVNLRCSNSGPITLQADGLIELEPRYKVPDGLFAVRGKISTRDPVRGGASNWRIIPGDDPDASAILRWEATIEPTESRSIYFKTPFVELLDAEEMVRLKEIDFEQEVRRICGYWRSRLANGMQIDVPDEALKNFYKANLWHNVITTDRDPVTGLYNQGVATVRYRVFANETVMIARSMDMRGEHTEAERFLEPLLHYQGTERLKGRFSTQEGAFHGAGDYTHGEYAMNHGFVLWGVADHYLMTRDRKYLERVAPKLLKGCDFLISERASTMTPPCSSPWPIHGLSPASSLEDVVEYQHWFATNAYFYLGMKRTAQALADIRHPQAGRITAEAEKYRQDIEAAVREAATKSAVVPLRDGSFIPYVPSRVHQWRHLTEGWIREALYCSLHLATAEVLSPDDPVITWMLDDLEDNIFFSWQSGYNVADYEQRWFERGGITLQPCLLDTPIVYMARDEIAAALRAFWNTYALSIYPDVHCFAEWARRFGVAGGPVYKTSDESRFVMWLRQLLIWEDGNRLWFARAVPGEWLQDGNIIRVEHAPTLFGSAGMVIRSQTARRRIHATLKLPERNPAAEVWLRLRHPQGLWPKRVFANGAVVEQERIVGADIRVVPGVKDPSQPVMLVAEY